MVGQGGGPPGIDSRSSLRTQGLLAGSWGVRPGMDPHTRVRKSCPPHWFPLCSLKCSLCLLQSDLGRAQPGLSVTAALSFKENHRRGGSRGLSRSTRPLTSHPYPCLIHPESRLLFEAPSYLQIFPPVFFQNTECDNTSHLSHPLYLF